MSQAQKIESNQKKLRANEIKWGVELVEAGWTMFPSTILEHQEALGLDPVDMNILLQLARYWWRADNPPHPAIKTIAACIKKSPSTVQRRITRLKEAGLIEVEHRFDERHHGQKTSNYRFTGLIDEATKFARLALEEKEETKSRKAARLKLKNPRSRAAIRVVEGTMPTDK
ncbi:MAG TPA: helix-turn-helix domain-containing protein [Pirellulales bacterium]|nr:helix-turn-helix domain-containing protein [Pirellulales bacterium]